MAEIRSTMDMVMERAAKMAADSKENTENDAAERTGMRLAAEHLQTGDGNLMSILQEQNKDDQLAILKGMTDTLLRNIVLPRDEHLLEGSMTALQCVADLSSSEVSSICGELQQILTQYSQHKEQMMQQIDDAIRNQLKQKLAEQGTELSDDMSINPAMHPQYQEEVSRVLSDLNSQYNEALDQRKEMIRQRVVPAER